MGGFGRKQRVHLPGSIGWIRRRVARLEAKLAVEERRLVKARRRQFDALLLIKKEDRRPSLVDDRFIQAYERYRRASTEVSQFAQSSLSIGVKLVKSKEVLLRSFARQQGRLVLADAAAQVSQPKLAVSCGPA